MYPTTIFNLVRYALALKLDIGKLLSECLEPHLEDEPKPEAKVKKPRK